MNNQCYGICFSWNELRAMHSYIPTRSNNTIVRMCELLVMGSSGRIRDPQLKVDDLTQDIWNRIAVKTGRKDFKIIGTFLDDVTKKLFIKFTYE